MRRILTGSLTGVLFVLACAVPGSSTAASPPSVFVRVEGTAATLLPETPVTTTSATRLRGNLCPGSSAAAALDLATEGSWTGAYDSRFDDYLVGTILGEKPSGANNFWTLWVNGRSSTTGACSTSLAPGDHELWFDCQAGGPPAFACSNNPLALAAPLSVARGHRLTVTVNQLDGAGHRKAFAGAAVTGAGGAALSGAGGRATLVPTQIGVLAIQAAASGATPSDPVFVCVYARRASECGAAGGGGPPVHVTGIREHQQFTSPLRVLSGTAGPDSSGLIDVSLSLLRRASNGHCSVYDGNTGSWRASACSATPPPFSVGASANWSYLLPAALPAGSYRLEVIADDGAGRQTKLVTGGSRIDFSVRKR